MWKYISREVCPRLSIAPCLPCGLLSRLDFIFCHQSSAFAWHHLSNCQFPPSAAHAWAQYVMRCLPLCPLPKCHSDRKLVAPSSPPAKRASYRINRSTPDSHQKLPIVKCCMWYCHVVTPIESQLHPQSIVFPNEMSCPLLSLLSEVR